MRSLSDGYVPNILLKNAIINITGKAIPAISDKTISRKNSIIKSSHLIHYFCVTVAEVFDAYNRG